MSFIAVHIGAGYHSPLNDERNNQLIKDALSRGYAHFQTNDALSTIELVIRILEASPLTNTVTEQSN